MADVFISYSRKDEEFVLRLAEALKRHKHKAWIDKQGIRPAEEWMQAIHSAIEGADTFLFVLSPDSIISKVCPDEIAHALAHNKRIVPVIARDVDEKVVPKSLSKLNYIDCRESDDFDAKIEEIIAALNTDLDWVRAHTRLDVRSVEWEAKEKNGSFVLRDVDLRAAEQWLTEAGADKERQPTALQTEFIIASRKAETRRQRTIRTWVTVAAGIAVVLAIIALVQRTKAVAQEKIAIENAGKARRTSVQADFDLGQIYRQKADMVEPQTLVHLARALRTDGTAALPREYLISLLRDRPWYLPTAEPLRHADRVFAASFSADGRRVLTASWDKTVRIWEVETCRQVGESIRHKEHILAVAMSPDGRRIVTVSADHTGQVWDAEIGQPIGNAFRHDPPPSGTFLTEGRMVGVGAISWRIGDAQGNSYPIGAAGFSPDGKRMVTACLDNVALIWDPETGRKIGMPLGHKGRITAARFSSDGLKIVTASEDNTARMWDAQSGTPIGEPMRHQAQVLAARFSADDQRIVTASADKTARVWDANLLTPLGEPLRHNDWVLAASFSSDGRQIVTASADKTAGVWQLDPKSGVPVPDSKSGQPAAMLLQHEDMVLAADFSADGRRIVTAAADNSARVWSALSGKALGNPLLHDGAVRVASFDPGGRLILTAAADSTVRLWDVAEDEPPPKSVPYGGKIVTASFASDRRRVVVADPSSFPRLVDPENGKLVAKLRMPEMSGRVVGKFSPNGRHLVTASSEGVVRVWDSMDGAQLAAFRHEKPVNSVSFSPDGRWFVFGSDDTTARVCETENGQPSRPFLEQRAPVTSAEFSADGGRIITSCKDGTVWVWDAIKRKPIGQVLKHEGEVVVKVSSDDGRRLVTGSVDKTARVWDVETGTPVCDPLPHESTVTSASFSKDGRRVVTVSGDQAVRVWSVRVWEVATGKLVGEPVRHDRAVVAASLSANGQRVVTASGDFTERLWDTESGKPLSEPVRQNLRIVKASFSADERQIVTALADGAIRTWDIAADLKSPLPQWLPELAEALGGRRFNEEGLLVPPQKTVIELRKELLALKGDDFWSRFGRWFFTRGSERTISPDSNVTVGDFNRMRAAAAKPQAETPAASP